MQKLLSASLLAAGIVAAAPAFAADDLTVLSGSTADASKWQAQYLGDPFTWSGPLDINAYENVFEVSPYPTWTTELSWISLYENTVGPDGYYSYMTTIDGSTVALKELGIKHSSDNWLHAIVINDVLYGGFSSQDKNAFDGWTVDNLDGINNWNVNGSNKIEFIVYNGYGSVSSSMSGLPNPTGFAVEIYTTAIPEPETYAMMLAGLGIVGAIVRRRRIR